MSGATTAQQLAAAGAEIPFADGSTAQLRFTMRAVLEVEKVFGGVKQLIDIVNAPSTYDPVFTQVRDALRCGLAGQTFQRRTAMPDGTVEIDTHAAYDDDALDDLIEPGKLQLYIAAIAAALEEAFPAAEDTTGSGRGKARATGGARGSTTPRSRSAGRAASSGT